jgi:hypothetical protein
MEEEEVTSPNQEQIERRAYELYVERGREDGHAVEDWLAAEAELMDKYQESITPKKVGDKDIAVKPKRSSAVA